MSAVAPASEAATSCGTSVAPPALPVREAARLARVLKAVADPNRLRLLSLLVGSEDGELCVCDLTAPLGLSQSTVSHHLKIMLDVGLVERETRGVWRFYRVVPESLAGLGALFTTGPVAVKI